MARTAAAVAAGDQPTNNSAGARKAAGPRLVDRPPKPENEIVVKTPGSSGETVNQRRLREFYELQNEYYDLRSRYHAALLKIQDLILGGANVQQGSYKVQHNIRYVRRPRYKQVVIDLKGEAYQQRVLNSTPPHAHFRVTVK